LGIPRVLQRPENLEGVFTFDLAQTGEISEDICSANNLEDGLRYRG